MRARNRHGAGGLQLSACRHACLRARCGGIALPCPTVQQELRGQQDIRPRDGARLSGISGSAHCHQLRHAGRAHRSGRSHQRGDDGHRRRRDVRYRACRIRLADLRRHRGRPCARDHRWHDYGGSHSGGLLGRKHLVGIGRHRRLHRECYLFAYPVLLAVPFTHARGAGGRSAASGRHNRAGPRPDR